MGIPAALVVLSLPALAASGYLGAMGLLARPIRRGSPASACATDLPHFTFVVPAHNESAGIARTVESLGSVEYPKDRFAIMVVADNCSDETARRAQEAGARVVERNDATRRGKGYALRLAFDLLLEERATDAVVVVDADTDVSPNLLLAMAERILEGAAAMQAHYAVRNVEDSWRTRLMDVAFTVYHGVRSQARERLGLSSGLRGNGMGLTLETLRKVPYGAYSLVEDVEYGIELGLHGIRVVYVDEAEVRGEMVAGDAGSTSQRRRWEQGRKQLIGQSLPKLLKRGILERNPVLLDLACDILVPPLATVVAYTGVGTAFSAGAVMTGLAGPTVLLPWLSSVLGISAYVTRGAVMTGRGTRVLLDLAYVPQYMFWKVATSWRSTSMATGDWIRTARKSDG